MNVKWNLFQFVTIEEYIEIKVFVFPTVQFQERDSYGLYTRSENWMKNNGFESIIQ